MTHNVERKVPAHGAGIDVPHLIIETDGLAAGPVTLQDELTIGRAEDNDLELMDPKVSRHHARITRQGTNYVVTDLGSANGTLVDGVPLTGPHVLQHGERITVGDSELTYREPGQASATTLKTATPTLVGQGTIGPPTATGGRTQLGRQQGVVPPPPVRAADHGPERLKPEGRGPIVGLLLTGGVLLLAIIAVGAYLLLPRLKQGGQETAVPTAPVAQVSETVVITVLPGVETPLATTQPTTPTQALSAQEMDDLLAQAKGLAAESDFEAAVAIYEDLAQRAPDDPRPQIGWAWALILDYDPEQAELHAQKAFDLNPNNVDAVVALARALVDKGEKARALAVAQQAVALGSGTASARTVLAEALRLNERYAEAVDEADRALVLDNNSADAHRARGWLYYLADQDVGQANGQLQIALSLQTELWMRRHEYGELLLQEGNYTTALIAFQDALQLRPKPVTYTAIGEAYYRLGQYDPARVSLEQAETAGADDARSKALLAAIYAKLGRCSQAGSYITQVLAQDAGNALALEAQSTCQAAALTPTAQPTTQITDATVAPTATSNPTPTPTATRQAPAASISGRIAFPAWNNETNMYDVWIYNVDSGGRNKVAANMEMPAFSPDGKWLAVKGAQSDMQNLYIIRPNGTELRRVSENIEDKLPTWSPDNGRIAYASTKQGPDHPKKVYVNDKPFEGRKPSSREIVSDRGPIQGVYLHWMPDGRIVYQGCDYQPDPDVCGLFTIADGGGKFTQVTRDERDTAPAGYGGRIAFMSNRDGNWEIYVVREDGTGLKRLTNNASDDGLPAWSPDGKTIAFVSNQGGAWAVWVMNADGSRRRELFELGGEGLKPYWTEMGLNYQWIDQRISWAP